MDNLSKRDRSKCMSHIRSKNTSIEKRMFSLLNQKGVKYKRHYKMFGRPDIAFLEPRIAVFLDSDFWHGWNFSRWKNKLPKEYWRDKIEYNRKRDRLKFSRLKSMGWKVIRIWSHKIEKSPEGCLRRILRALNK